MFNRTTTIYSTRCSIVGGKELYHLSNCAIHSMKRRIQASRVSLELRKRRLSFVLDRI